MTEKQYRLNKWGTRLLKNNRPLFDWANESDDIVELLNEQEELIKRLKIIREEQTETILKQKRKIKELTAQLQIDDVCIKCKHHYLINYPESSKYDISKCKKEHEECSKEDIRFCEDFELKSDVGMTTKDCFHCYYAQSNEDGIHCYRKTRTKVKGTDTCEYYKK